MRAVSVESRNKASDLGFKPRPKGEQSFRVQKQGMRMRRAPDVMRARKASGKARSQQISIPTFPRGVSIVMCGSWVEDVRWARSGCLSMLGWDFGDSRLGCGRRERLKCLSARSS